MNSEIDRLSIAAERGCSAPSRTPCSTPTGRSCTTCAGPGLKLLDRCRAWLFSTLANALFDPYRPEPHDTRGPGPKWRAKYRRAR